MSENNKKLVSLKEVFTKADLKGLATYPRRTLGTAVLLAIAFPGKYYLLPEQAQQLNPHVAMDKLMAVAMEQANANPALMSGDASTAAQKMNQQEAMKKFQEFFDKTEVYAEVGDLLKLNDLAYTVFGGQDDSAKWADILAALPDHSDKLAKGEIQPVDVSKFVDDLGKTVAPMLAMLGAVGQSPFGGGGGRGGAGGGGRGPRFQ